MNIAKILKNYPKGTKLYSPLFGDVQLVNVESGIISDYIINVRNEKNIIVNFYSDGRYFESGECMLFPSKEDRSWNNMICNHKQFTTGEPVLTLYYSKDIPRWKYNIYSHWDRDEQRHVCGFGLFKDNEVHAYDESLVGEPCGDGR